jgi:hypothetical protein
MHFTVVFESHEATDLSYGMAFAASAMWLQGSRQVVNLHPDHPGYDRGDLVALLEAEDVGSRSAGTGRAVVVVHSTGNGTEADLDNLMADLRAAGFDAVVVGL